MFMDIFIHFVILEYFHWLLHAFAVRTFQWPDSSLLWSGLIVCLKLSYLIIPNLLSRLRVCVYYVAAAIVGFVRPVQSRSTITDNS